MREVHAMNEKDLRSIIEQVLAEMNGASEAKEAAPSCCTAAPVEENCKVEEGCLPDITEIDIREQ